MSVMIRIFGRSITGTIRANQPGLQGERHILVDGVGVRQLAFDTVFRQEIENDARLNFQFTRQLVDPDFLHR
jgi:hypothetical protein